MPRNGVILLVEDNSDDEVLVLRTLHRYGVANRVEVVRDGAEALDFLFRRGSHAGRDESSDPQVVLLDLKLPKVSGHDILRQIRADENLRPLPVVILTSSDEDRDVAQSYANGANSYVRKPVDFAEFADAVRQLGLYWVLLNRVPNGVK
ncbi:MAG: response regulator [Deltaproteobacteria bacterium]|nr:response regulator [Deltaproteobacteria bacterium]